MAGPSTLLTAADLTYLGSFELPVTVDGYGFDYGATALAFNPAHGSLFLVGHPDRLYTAEVTIPAIGGRATVLQPLTDALHGHIGDVGPGPWRIAGQLVADGRLIVTAYVYYDADGAQTLTHFSRATTLSDPAVTGPVSLGFAPAGMLSGYMGHVPDAWQSALGGPALTGNAGISIITRTSFGPAAFAFDPATLGPAQPCVYYPTDHTTLGAWADPGPNPIFNGTSQMRGIVFPDGTDSVLVIGTTGFGPHCYGTGGPSGECPDPANYAKGDHAYPYYPYVWAYDASALAAVVAGTRQPWDVVPYASWAILEVGESLNDSVGGATIDPATNTLYVSFRKESPSPRILVFQIGAPSGPSIPPPEIPQPPSGPVSLPTTGLTLHCRADVTTHLFTTENGGGSGVHTGTPADGGGVQVWDDEGDGITDVILGYSTATPNYRSGTPLMKASCLDFDGSTMYLACQNQAAAGSRRLDDVIAAGAFTVIVAFYPEAITTTAASIYDNAALFCNGDGTNGGDWGLHTKDVGGVKTLIGYNDETAQPANVISRPISTGHTWIAVYRHAGGLIKLTTIDEAGTESSASDVASGNTAVAGLAVRLQVGTNYAKTAWYNGRIGEFATWNVDLAANGTDLADAKQYFKDQWLSLTATDFMLVAP